MNEENEEKELKAKPISIRTTASRAKKLKELEREAGVTRNQIVEWLIDLGAEPLKARIKMMRAAFPSPAGN